MAVSELVLQGVTPASLLRWESAMCHLESAFVPSHKGKEHLSRESACHSEPIPLNKITNKFN